MNEHLIAKFISLITSIPKHLSAVASINVPNLTTESASEGGDESLLSYLASLKTELFTYVSTAKCSANSVPSKVVPVLHQLVCLLLEDFKFSKDSFVNCLIYLEDILTTIDLIIRESKPYPLAVDMVARCKYKLSARKRNIQNNVEDVDYVLKMNFLNRFVDLDSGLTALKELMMMKTIWQHYNMRSRVRGGEPHLVEYLIPDFGDSELSLSDIRYKVSFSFNPINIDLILGVAASVTRVQMPPPVPVRMSTPVRKLKLCSITTLR